MARFLAHRVVGERRLNEDPAARRGRFREAHEGESTPKDRDLGIGDAVDGRDHEATVRLRGDPIRDEPYALAAQDLDRLQRSRTRREAEETAVRAAGHERAVRGTSGA